MCVRVCVCMRWVFVLLLNPGKLITGGVTGQQIATTPADPLHRQKAKNTTIKKAGKRIFVGGKHRKRHV